ncbi:MAG: HD domain-containing protein [Synergistaceae bacterium]|nr:HD domain-containing protein [Synergistaceae bacterium]
MFIKISPAAEKALSILTRNGFESCLVGGCVRDMLMGYGCASKDWDIATSAAPRQVMEVFCGHRVVETGIKHGTVTVLIDGEPLEITTFRKDVGYSDHRHPDAVVFASTLKEDVSRRDFTMNALAYDPERGLIDHFGGAEDIGAQIIRCVGDADQRFNEDALRILRALRFSSALGFEIERGTAASIHKNMELLRSVSAERVNGELTKLICGRNAGAVLRKFADVVGVVIPEILPMVGFGQHNKFHCFDVWRHTIAVIENSEPECVLRWAAFFHDIGKPDCFALGSDGAGHFHGHAAVSKLKADATMRRLKFDNASRELITALIAHHDIPIPAEARTVRRYLNRLGEDVLRQLLLLKRADVMGHAPQYHSRIHDIERTRAVMEQILAEESCFSLKDLAVKGNDMIALGLKGRQIGAALNFLLNAVMDEQTPNERARLLEYLDKNYIF